MSARSLAALTIAVVAASGCTCGRGSEAPRANGTRQAGPIAIVETVYDSKWGKGWADWGWSTRELVEGKPARVDLSNYGGWMLGKPGFDGVFGGLTFRYRAPREYGEFLEVRVESTQQNVYPRIVVGAKHRIDQADDWAEVVIPMKELDPENLPFDRIVFHAVRPIGKAWVSFDKIGFLAPDASASADAGAPALRDVVMSVDCRAEAQPINPQIYGIAIYPPDGPSPNHQFETFAGARRWGGNLTTRYNWELGNAWNAGSDWFFENLDYLGAGWSYTKFLAENAEHHMATALTVPMIGWVAKDTTSFGFPVSKLGPQQSTDQYRPDAGNGLRADGSKLPSGSPTFTSVEAPADFVKRWVEAIRAADEKSGKRSVWMYVLDNEPALWSVTHRDVHPDPLGYDELLARTIDYGSAIRAADPDALIAGPAEWGWTNYLFSAKDMAAGGGKPDRLAHDDLPLLAWYLRELAAHEKKTGTRVLDVVDVHFYPQAARVYGNNGGIDAQTAALRIRSTRAWWDPKYADESWIKEPVRLIPRLKQWIAENYPGRGISIGEWNFGAEQHMSGGLAVAESLGRFAEGGLTSAFYWAYPPKNSPAFWAFRAYRNFDGHGGRFLDWSLPTGAGDGYSLFASRDATGGHIVAIALNLSPNQPLRPKVVMVGCRKVIKQRVFEFTGDPSGFKEGRGGEVEGVVSLDKLPPYSITVLDLETEPAK